MARPTPYAVYTARELYQLELLDSPHLRFCVDGCLVVIQNSHLMDEELLSVPGFADTRWRYIRTTYEWIPLFTAVNDAEVRACVDIEPGTSPFSEPGELWVTPKGFYREQFSYA